MEQNVLCVQQERVKRLTHTLSSILQTGDYQLRRLHRRLSRGDLQILKHIQTHSECVLFTSLSLTRTHTHTHSVWPQMLVSHFKVFALRLCFVSHCRSVNDFSCPAC